MGGMLTLDITMLRVKDAIFGQGIGFVVYVKIWHKCFAHMNY